MNERRFDGMGHVGHPDATFETLDCGYCGRSVSAHVTSLYHGSDGRIIWWMICPMCSYGSVKDSEGNIYPVKKFGDYLQGLPPDVEQAYDEARNCFSVKAYSACTLICRKLLMHIAVDKGDTAGKQFVEYINYLQTNGFITAVMNDWVGKIREGGNESTHELPPASDGKAKNILLFTIQLLRNVYEMKYIADQQTGQITNDHAIEETLKDSK